MSERHHVSDAAWEAFVKRNPWALRDILEDAVRKDGTVLLTVEEHEELLKQEQLAEGRLRSWQQQTELTIRATAQAQAFGAERDALRAEVDRLRNESIQINSMLDDAGREIERLRKGREDEQTGQIPSGNIGAGDMGSRLCRGMDGGGALDPRFGLPQS